MFHCQTCNKKKKKEQKRNRILCKSCYFSQLKASKLKNNSNTKDSVSQIKPFSELDEKRKNEVVTKAISFLEKVSEGDIKSLLEAICRHLDVNQDSRVKEELVSIDPS